jgi:hypothetical protein
MAAPDVPGQAIDSARIFIYRRALSDLPGTLARQRAVVTRHFILRHDTITAAGNAFNR